MILMQLSRVVFPEIAQAFGVEVIADLDSDFVPSFVLHNYESVIWYSSGQSRLLPEQ